MAFAGWFRLLETHSFKIDGAARRRGPAEIPINFVVGEQATHRREQLVKIPGLCCRSPYGRNGLHLSRKNCLSEVRQGNAFGSRASQQATLDFRLKINCYLHSGDLPHTRPKSINPNRTSTFNNRTRM